jgi:hypothetical protein
VERLLEPRSLVIVVPFKDAIEFGHPGGEDCFLAQTVDFGEGPVEGIPLEIRTSPSHSGQLHVSPQPRPRQDLHLPMLGSSKSEFNFTQSVPLIVTAIPFHSPNPFLYIVLEDFSEVVM